MHVTALVKSLDHVCCRYRVSAYRPFLERAGHRLDIVALPRGWLHGFRLPRRLPPSDVIVVQRQLLAPDQLADLRRAARWLVFDFDDAVFQRDSYDRRGQHSDGRLAGFARMVRAADVVVAGNHFLAEQAALYKAPAHIRVVPTSVDPSRYVPVDHHRRGVRMHLAWIGSSATLRGLERAHDLWEEIGRRLPAATLRVICDRPLQLKNLAVRFCPWVEPSEAMDLASADIGISWLPDDAWTRGKCGLKVLQYLAAGLPVIANPVGLQADLVGQGGAGFCATTCDDWVNAIVTLGRDPALRQRLGMAGRRLVEERFDVSRGAGQWLELLEQLARAAAVRGLSA